MSQAIVEESLVRAIHEEDKEWRDWFDALGNDDDDISVEFASAAQSEVALSDG
jgi:hypothetical protein